MIDFKLLLVEDNVIIASVMERLFTNAGCLIDIASTGVQALELFNNDHYDLILMDIGLPDSDGFSISRKIRACDDKTRANTPIVIVTAHSGRKSYLEQARDIGVDDFIVKPCTFAICDMLIKKFNKKKQSDSFPLSHSPLYFENCLSIK